MKSMMRGAGMLVVATFLGAFGAPAISGANPTPLPTLYAASTAAGTGDCSSAPNACALSTALADVVAGETIELVTAGVPGDTATYYEGGFSVSTSGTSSGSPVWIIADGGLASPPILDGGDTQQVLAVGDVYLVIEGVTIEHGSAATGGGIANNEGGNVSIFNSSFSDNSAVSNGSPVESGFGGAIVNGFSGSGTLSVSSTTFSSNTAVNGGGAISNGYGSSGGSSTVTVTDSSFSGNSANAGGAIDNADLGKATLTVSGSTFTGNSSGAGGAVANGYEQGTGTASITGSTFSNNSAGSGHGGAIDNGDYFSDSTLAVTTSTFTGNSAGNGGAIDNADVFNSGSSLTITASTLSGNTATSHGSDIDSGGGSSGGRLTVGADLITDGCAQTSGIWSDEGYNVGADASCFNGGAGDDDSAGPNLSSLLGPLADHDGPTQTMALLTGNPAVGIMPDPTAGLCPVAADQRGVASASGQPCDAGAVQMTTVVTSAYTPVTPYRICDTRGTNGLSGTDAQCAGQRLSAGGTRTIDVSGTNPSGSSSGGVPSSGVRAVVVNVTATGEAAQGFVTVWPAGFSRPAASSLNYRADKAVANLVTVSLSATGQISLYSLQGTDLVVDVEGYYAAPSGTAGLFNSVTPYRICDTRGTNGLVGTNAQCAGLTLSAGVPLDLAVTGTDPSGTSAGGVPASGVSAVVVNVTAIGHGTGYVTAFPQGQSPPTASNLNFSSGQVVPNRVIVPVSATGQISLVSNTSADVVVDVNGWFTDGSSDAQTGADFVASTPSRICDTRKGNATPCAGMTVTGGAAPVTVPVDGQRPVPSSGVVAVVANVTVTDTTAQSYLTAWPSGGARPTASDLNWVAGLTVPNMAVVGLGTGGDLSVYVDSGSADVIIDVTGWYVDDDTTSQSNLTNALTAAKASYVSSGSYQSTPAAEVALLSESEPSLAFTTGNSTGQNVISVGVYQQAYQTVESPYDVIVLAVYSAGTGRCWWASDVEDAAVPTGYDGVIEPGTNYAETDPVNDTQCDAGNVNGVSPLPDLDSSSYPT